MEGKQLVGADEMVAKVAAAVAARQSSELIVIARTDARAVEGLDAALQRARAYRNAGADMLFVEAPQSVGEIETIAQALHGVPLLFNYAEGGKTPAVSYQFLRELGFQLVIFPLSALLVATAAIRSVLAEIRAKGTPIDALGSMLPFGEFLEFIGVGEIDELERRFATDTPNPAGQTSQG
jgi:2-methylisocitrate lyase-like PEP mutase family enzyme